MGYEHIIAARKKLQELGVPHLGFGGGFGGVLVNPSFDRFGDIGHPFLGGGAGGANGNPLERINPFTPTAGNQFSALDPSTWKGFSNPLSSITPQNSFQATAPGIQTNDWKTPMNSAYWDYKNSQAGLGDQFSDLRGLSGKQLDTSAGIGTQAGNVAGLAGADGLGRVLSGQQSLGQALLAQSRGQGPNPAQDQYKRNVEQDIRQNAGAIASQKGINPALAGYMAAQNAGAMENQAAGNAATLQAEQQLAAEGELGNNLAQQGQTVMGKGQLYDTAGNLIGQQVGAQGASGQTMANAGQIAGTMGNEANAFYGTNVSGLGNENNATNTASLGTQGINASVANANTQAKQGVTGGLLNAGGGLLGGLLGGKGGGSTGLGFAGGGEVPDESSMVLSRILASDETPRGGAGGGGGGGGGLGGAGMGILGNGVGSWLGSNLGDLFSSGSLDSADSLLGSSAGDEAGMAGALGDAGTVLAAKGGEIPDQKAMCLAQALMARGGAVPGRAKVLGNSLRNDVVPAVLSPGEVVLPRSVTQAADAPEKAARFLAAIKERDAAKEPQGYGQVLTKVRAIRQRLGELEQHLGRAS